MRYASLSSLLIATVLVTACGPTGIMGRGYTAYREPYKSAPGTKPAPLGYTYTQPNNSAVIEAMRPAARDLVAQMENKIDPSVERIYLTQGAQTAFYSAMDHVLREELTYRGFELVTQPEASALSVNASASQTETGMYVMALTGAAGTLASGTYEVPGYAFTGTSAPQPMEAKSDGQMPVISPDDTSAPVPITQVTAEPLAEESAAAPVADIPAQTNAAP